MHLQRRASCSTEVCCKLPPVFFFVWRACIGRGRISGVVQVHEVKGNLSTAGLQRVFERCTAAGRGPFPVQRGSGARMRGVYGCTVFTGACTVFTGARCSPVHGVHGCTMFYGARAARCFTGAHYFQVCIICIDSLVGPLGKEVRLITTAVDGCRGDCGCAVRLSLLALHLSDLPLLTAGVRLRAVIEVRLVRHGTARDWQNTAHQRTRLARRGAASPEESFN